MLRLFAPVKENCVQSVTILLKELNVKVTAASVRTDLQSHPDYPSLLSVGDVLSGYGVEHVSFKSNAAHLKDMPTPFLAQLKGNDRRDVFTVVRSVENGTVCFFNPDKHFFETIRTEDFEKKWVSQILLLAEAGEQAGEKDYAKKRRAQLRNSMLTLSAILAIPVISVVTILLNVIQHGRAAWGPSLFTFITLLGCITGFLLLWYEVDSHNPHLNQLCNLNKKASCHAVLQSKASKIWGIKWSTIGLTYFSGSLLALLFSGITNSHLLSILSWLNIIAAPYIIFSLYFQWRVIKQWCVLCLTVQALLAAQLATTLAAGWPGIIMESGPSLTDLLIPVSTAFLVPVLFLNLFVPAYRHSKEGRGHKTELQRLKHDPQIFDALLAKQKILTESSKGLGIMLGNPDASNKIIKVCNPYCGPCARAHKPLEELLHNNPDLQVQIIFTASNLEGDRQTAPVKHLLAIAQKGNAGMLVQALDDWYLADKKDYETFARKYPVNGELETQGPMVEAMYAWCSKTAIAFTPTIFFNNYQLPEMYNVSDLKYFLSA